MPGTARPCLLQSNCIAAKMTLDPGEFKVANKALHFLSVYEYLPKKFSTFLSNWEELRNITTGGVHKKKY